MSDHSQDSLAGRAAAAGGEAGGPVGSDGEGELKEDGLDKVAGGVQLPDVPPPHRVDPPVFIV